MPTHPIQHPEPVASHIRKRPGMYIGGFNENGLKNLIEVVIDEQLRETGDRLSSVRITLLADGFFEIECIGAIADIRPEHFIDFVERDDSKWNIELAVLEAMSDHLDVEVIRDGRRWRQSLAAGVALAPPSYDRMDRPSVLRLRYRLDPALFKGLELSPFRLLGQIQEFAIFHRLTVFEVDDQRTGRASRRFHYPLGLVSYSEELEYDRIGFWHDAKPFHFELTEGPNRAQAVIVRTDFAQYVMRSYANGRRTPDGGAHVKGFEDAFRKIASQYREREGYPFARGNDPFHGLTVLLAVDLADARYGGSTKAKLDGEIPSRLVSRMIGEQVGKILASMCK